MTKNINWEISKPQKTTNLSKKDALILDLIKFNARLPQKHIAKKLRITNVAVHNRIKNLEKRKIIQGYSCIINFNAIGFQTIQIGIKTTEPNYFEKIKDNKFISQILYLSGNHWNYLIRIISPKEKLNQIIDEITPKHGEIEILQIEKGFIDGKEVFQKKEKKLSKTETELIKELSENSKQSIAKIAFKLNISVSSLIKKLKKLEKEEIIQNYSTLHNPYLFGNIAFISIINSHRENADKIAKTLSKLNSTGTLENFENPNLISFHIVKDFIQKDEIEKTIQELNIKNYIFIDIKAQQKYEYLPKGIFEEMNKKIK